MANGYKNSAILWIYETHSSYRCHCWEDERGLGTTIKRMFAFSFGSVRQYVGVIKLERELGQKQPKLYEIIGGKFFCVPFLENVKTGTSWNICRHLLDKTYSNLLPNAGVHEYYRSGMVMEVRHIDLSNESTPANEIEHLIQNEILKISSFECELDVIIVAFRYIILQRANINMALGNHDLCGWIAASVLLLKETIVNDSKEFIPSSADAIHQQAMIESTLYCMSLLWTVHTKGKDDISIFWKILHGPTLHKCQVRAKKGATPLQMVGKENLMDFYIMYKKVQSGLQSYIDTVMDYGSDFQLQTTD
ncbi:hypothetical protein BC833DRAFT_92699 [Globomyces pollinis-pini]|nr:hypothetical protein BC833DRAFT_92699 [Globomyces pollinis-pini]